MTTNLRRAIYALSAAGLLATSSLSSPVSAQTSDATPTVAGCAAVAMATPGAGTMSNEQGGHGMDDTAEMMHEIEYDLMYIDMMIPHHESVIALAEAAQYELTHPRLIEIAQAIVATQQGEIEHLQQLRSEWYGDAEPVSMEIMMEMPGIGADMTAMEQQMDAAWQVQTFCAAEDKDLTFIDQVIPHHQMAIDTSEAAVEIAVHPELAEIARAVIIAQEAEIAELEMIRAEITGEATPTE